MAEVVPIPESALTEDSFSQLVEWAHSRATRRINEEE